MAYRIGHCPSCDIAIQVKDTKGVWYNKENYRQAYISFADGQKVKTIICKDCLASGKMNEVLESIIDPNSKAQSKTTIALIKSKGDPVTLEEWKG